jgi:hypothetical protein
MSRRGERKSACSGGAAETVFDDTRLCADRRRSQIDVTVRLDVLFRVLDGRELQRVAAQSLEIEDFRVNVRRNGPGGAMCRRGCRDEQQNDADRSRARCGPVNVSPP